MDGILHVIYGSVKIRKNTLWSLSLTHTHHGRLAGHAEKVTAPAMIKVTHQVIKSEQRLPSGTHTLVAFKEKLSNRRSK